MDAKAIENKIRFILKKNLKKKGLEGEISSSQQLIGSGILDSLSTLELIAGLEKVFKIKVSPEEMTEANFGSVAVIRDFIRVRLGVRK